MSSHAFGVDIGGSGIKGSIVDLDVGELAEARFRIKTPQPATPEAVTEVVRQIVAKFDWGGPVGVAFPAVVQHGVVRTAANVDQSWIGSDADALLTDVLGAAVTMLNDADAAGLAEMRFGEGVGHEGLVLLLTFGTGIGSALFHEGRLVPNTEFGHLEFRGMLAEHYAAGRLVERDDMKLDWWASRVNEFLMHLERVVSPDLFVFGGGISKRFAEFADAFSTRAPVRPAKLRNNAGIVGAAMAAHERFEQ
jgi:polyphosphate glucokinase